jgi:hypothetical protein
LPADLSATFAALKPLVAAHAKGRQVLHDTPDHYCLNEAAPNAQQTLKGKAVFFGAVKIGSGKVALHLFPLYTRPDLLDGLSDELKKHRQGKSCFNFKTPPDAALVAELKALIKTCAHP